MPSLNRGGVHLHYEIYGEGPAIFALTRIFGDLPDVARPSRGFVPAAIV